MDLSSDRAVQGPLSPSTLSTQLFKLRLSVPSVPEGAYTGTLTFSVSP